MGKRAAHLGHASWAQHRPSWEVWADEWLSWCRHDLTMLLAEIVWSILMVDVGGMSGRGRGRVDEGRGKAGERAAFERHGTSCTRTTRPHIVTLHPQNIKEGDYGSDCSSGVFEEGRKPAGLHVAIHQLQAPSTANGSFLLSKALLLVFYPQALNCRKAIKPLIVLPVKQSMVSLLTPT